MARQARLEMIGQEADQMRRMQNESDNERRRLMMQVQAEQLKMMEDMRKAHDRGNWSSHSLVLPDYDRYANNSLLFMSM